jgi:alkaline phosphatase D
MTKIIFVFILVFLSFACQHSSDSLKEGETLAIMQGPTSSHETQLNILVPKKMKIELEIWLGGNKVDVIREKQRIERNHSDYSVIKLFLNNLKLENQYRLVVLNKDDFIIDERTFKTLDQNKTPLKIVVASCMNDVLNEIGDIVWPKVIEQKPDALFLIGDNVYADVYKGIYTGLAATPDHLWNRHVDSRSTLKLAKEKNLIPVFSTWDDHDSGVNDSNRHYTYIKEAQETFKSFFPQDKTENYQSFFGVGGKLRWGHLNFYFLDNRSFRDPAFADPGYHFGPEQESWLFKDMLSSAGDNIIISGDQFFGGYHNFESFEKHHSKNFHDFMSKVKKDKDKSIFISGDRHLFELMEIKDVLPYKTYELTTSAIHAKVFEGSLARDPNPRRIAGKDATYNFATIEFFESGKLNFEIKGLDHLGQVFYQGKFKVK